MKTILFIFLNLIIATMSFADETTILDREGLVRLKTTDVDVMSVEISVRCDTLSIHPVEITLLREDGLGNEIAAEPSGGCAYTAHYVSPGRWRIRAELGGESVEVLKVVKIS